MSCETRSTTHVHFAPAGLVSVCRRSRVLVARRVLGRRHAAARRGTVGCPHRRARERRPDVRGLPVARRGAALRSAGAAVRDLRPAAAALVRRRAARRRRDAPRGGHVFTGGRGCLSERAQGAGRRLPPGGGPTGRGLHRRSQRLRCRVPEPRVRGRPARRGLRARQRLRANRGRAVALRRRRTLSAGLYGRSSGEGGRSLQCQNWRHPAARAHGGDRV